MSRMRLLSAVLFCAGGSAIGQDISAQLYESGTGSSAVSVNQGTTVTVDVVIQQGAGLNINSLQFAVVDVTPASPFTASFTGVPVVPGSAGGGVLTYTSGGVGSPFVAADLLAAPGAGDPIGNGSLANPVAPISFFNDFLSPPDYTLNPGEQYSIISLGIDTTLMTPGIYTFQITGNGTFETIGGGTIVPGWTESGGGSGGIISGGSFTITINGGAPVPEPSTVVLMGAAAVLGAWRLRRRSGMTVGAPVV